ncbi:MAG: FkbM family methyltransferase [Gammaproteobacteria bacterium]
MRIRASATARKLLWRAGRKMYTYARGEGSNDPRTNGEYWLLDHVLRASNGPHVLLDVGANKGDWTAEALRLSSGSAHVHSFEPSSATRAMLSARFAESGHVTVQACALSNASGEATFYTHEAGAGTNSLSSTSGPHTEVIPVTTVDEFLQNSGIATVTMAKIDTEGFDLLVLEGARRSLGAGCIGILQFEYNSRWLLNHACLRDVFDLVRDTPYRVGKLVGHDLELYDGWHPELDRFFETNYVLIRNDSPLCSLATETRFDISSVGIQCSKLL